MFRLAFLHLTIWLYGCTAFKTPFRPSSALSPSFVRSNDSNRPRLSPSAAATIDSFSSSLSLASSSAEAATTTAAATTVNNPSSAGASQSQPQSQSKTGTVTILLPSIGSNDIKSKYGVKSPVESPTLLEAANHLADKVFWFSDGLVDVNVVQIASLSKKDGNGQEQAQAQQHQDLMTVDAVVAFGLNDQNDAAFVKNLFEARRSVPDAAIRARQCQFALDCTADGFADMVGPYDSTDPSLQSAVVPWSQDASGRRLFDQMNDLFARWTTDDFALALMLFFNLFSGMPVDWVRYSIDATWEKGPARNAQEFYQMMTKCGDCITKCLADENCKACIDALNAVDTRDQVASYRTVVSYESELLRDFSYCILQKNNVFGCRAKIPMLPKVKPITTWRGQEMTTDLARSILVGHLGDEPIAPEVRERVWITDEYDEKYGKGRSIQGMVGDRQRLACLFPFVFVIFSQNTKPFIFFRFHHSMPCIGGTRSRNIMDRCSRGERSLRPIPVSEPGRFVVSCQFRFLGVAVLRSLSCTEREREKETHDTTVTSSTSPWLSLHDHHYFPFPTSPSIDPQIFYEDVETDKMWYDPVFRVETIDGRNVWCKRHYTVRNGKVPGTFRLSVLDNGVTSNEFWTIGGVADDLSWIVFHYAGAATVVGQRYIGGLLCTPDGKLPDESTSSEWKAALESVSIQPWELYVVDNDMTSPGAVTAGKPPLMFYRDGVLQERKQKEAI